MNKRIDGESGLQLAGDRDLTIAYVSLGYAIGSTKGASILDEMLSKVEDKFVLAGTTSAGLSDEQQPVAFDDQETAVFMRVLDHVVEYHPDPKIVNSALRMMTDVAEIDSSQSYQSARAFHTV